MYVQISGSEYKKKMGKRPLKIHFVKFHIIFAKKNMNRVKILTNYQFANIPEEILKINIYIFSLISLKGRHFSSAIHKSLRSLVITCSHMTIIAVTHQ